MENVPHKGLDFLGKFNHPNLVPCLLGDDLACIAFIISLSGKGINFFQRSNIIISINFLVHKMAHTNMNSMSKTYLQYDLLYILFLRIQKLIHQENLYTSRQVFHSQLSHL